MKCNNVFEIDVVLQKIYYMNLKIHGLFNVYMFLYGLARKDIEAL